MKQTSKSALMMAGILLIIGVAALLSSTFAWLDVSRVPFISDLNVSVITENALWIAKDVDGKPGEWADILDASDLMKNMTPLKPVTYTSNGFQKIVYASDGRTNGVEPITEQNMNVRYPSDDDRTSKEAKEAEELGYITYIDFWLKTEGSSAYIYLTDAVETADGQMGAGTYFVGAPVWDDNTVSHVNGGYGSETTLRLGFEIQHTDQQDSPNPTSTKEFFIYEPNADIHTDPNLESDYYDTLNINGGNLIDDNHLIIQKASTWNEVTPTLADVVVYKAGTFLQNRNLLSIKSGEYVKVRLYFWMEGQDIDCIARAVTNAVSIKGNLKFAAVESTDRDIKIERR